MRSAEENSLQPAGDPSDASVKKVGEPWKGLSEPEDLPGVDDLLGWYDALCINQRDLLERSQQAHMMGDIYSSARNVAFS